MQPEDDPRAGVGLDGVVAATTRLSHIDGDRGALIIAGHDVEDLAPQASFEELVFLLLEDRVPDAAELQRVHEELRRGATLPPETLAMLRAAGDAEPIDALRLGVSTLSLRDTTPIALIGAVPAILAAHTRVAKGREPEAALDVNGVAARFLAACRDTVPAASHVRALETYWNTVCDHGMNASTFTARVIASTRSDLVASVEGALGALKGPLHGGAPGPALAAFLALRDAPDLDAATRAWVTAEVAAGRRIMGFGHRVYRVRDPRAAILGDAADRLLGDDDLLAEARVFETAVVETLATLKPGRSIETNVEFYTALLLHALGLEPRIFPAVFAVGRTAGWVAHVREQQAEGRLLRPRARYVGARGRRWACSAETTSSTV